MAPRRDMSFPFGYDPINDYDPVLEYYYYHIYHYNNWMETRNGRDDEEIITRHQMRRSRSQCDISPWGRYPRTCSSGSFTYNSPRVATPTTAFTPEGSIIGTSTPTPTPTTTDSSVSTPTPASFPSDEYFPAAECKSPAPPSAKSASDSCTLVSIPQSDPCARDTYTPTDDEIKSQSGQSTSCRTPMLSRPVQAITKGIRSGLSAVLRIGRRTGGQGASRRNRGGIELNEMK
ncbi:hypothetical protein GGS20DRAFT_568440 [Poronia punctata]|nr:hypothetical protein GGS20DRAFT_568440 [Poronia punctata]